MTAQKHVVLEHDSEPELVLPLIREQFTLQSLVLEKQYRSNHAQSGAVQVDMSLRASRYAFCFGPAGLIMCHNIPIIN